MKKHPSTVKPAVMVAYSFTLANSQNIHIYRSKQPAFTLLLTHTVIVVGYAKLRNPGGTQLTN